MSAARTTGGEIRVQNDSIARAFGAVLQDFRRTYVIRWVPRGVTRDGWHEVTVTVPKFKKYVVQTRKGYRAPTS
jgi:hypothetical protein